MNTTINFFSNGKMKLQDGILHVVYYSGTLIDENVLYSQMMCREQVTNNEDFFMLVDMRNDIEVTDEAIALAAANPSPEHVKAIAMVTKEGVDHTRVKLYAVFDKPNIKTKGFLSIEEAKLWFESLEQYDSMRKAS